MGGQRPPPTGIGPCWPYRRRSSRTAICPRCSMNWPAGSSKWCNSIASQWSCPRGRATPAPARRGPLRADVVLADIDLVIAARLQGLDFVCRLHRPGRQHGGKQQTRGDAPHTGCSPEKVHAALLTPAPRPGSVAAAPGVSGSRTTDGAATPRAATARGAAGTATCWLRSHRTDVRRGPTLAPCRCAARSRRCGRRSPSRRRPWRCRSAGCGS
jgi:hypothetical protein